jgi:hypothetical protein
MTQNSLTSWFRWPAAGQAPSCQVGGRQIEAFEADPHNPFLVSFPRTGSHWLRLLMELYFDRPSLVRVFYLHDRRDYLTRHVHDIDLDVERANVIYLYRDPAPTVFSQMAYHDQGDDDLSAIEHWSDRYGRHLAKWLVNERFTERKTVLRYERLKIDIEREFGKLCDHFDAPFDGGRLVRAAQTVSKAEVERKTEHDPKVIAKGRDYADRRERFLAAHRDRIRDRVLSVEPALGRHLAEVV